MKYPDAWWMDACDPLPFEMIASSVESPSIQIMGADEYEEQYAAEYVNDLGGHMMIIMVPVGPSIVEIHHAICEMNLGECGGYYTHPVRYMVFNTEREPIVDIHDGGVTLGRDHLDEIFEYVDLDKFNRTWYGILEDCYTRTMVHMAAAHLNLKEATKEVIDG